MNLKRLFIQLGLWMQRKCVIHVSLGLQPTGIRTNATELEIEWLGELPFHLLYLYNC